MNLRSDAISSRVRSVPAAETSSASGSSESGSWLARVSCRARNSLTTSSDSSRSSVMASSDVSAAPSASRRAAISASMLGDMFVAAGLGDAEPPHHQRQAEPEPDQRDEDDAEA